MDFISDRLTIQQLYGSPSYDISIETDDPNVITKRIEELAQFVIGSNPVHNDKEKWTPMEFKHNAGTSAHDDKALRGLIAAGMGFPEHMLFNQSTESNNGRESEAGQYSLYQLAMSKQSAFSDLFKNIHKFVAITAGKDPLSVDDGQLVFPEISTMSEKTKAETYALKVGAKICSRKTAALNTGHNWEIEQQQIQDEMAIFGDPGNDPTMAGVVGGRMSTRANNSDPNRDTGADDKGARSDPTNVRGNQTFGDHKASN
jgi:hypothetical protein